jgi:hypothetical protein
LPQTGDVVPDRNANYLEAAQALVTALGGRLITTEYRNAKSRIDVECANHHRFATNYDRLRQRKWCRLCYLAKRDNKLKFTVDDMRRVAQDRGGDCLSTAYRGMKVKLQWECREHGEFVATPNNVVHNNEWCPDCGELTKGRAQRPLPDVMAYVQEHGGEIVEGLASYAGSKSRIGIRCANGHTWSATTGSLLYARSWCPHCRRLLGESMVRRILEVTFRERFEKCRPHFLRQGNTGALELDGYASDLALAFEYQGPHHARSDQAARDRKKRRLCRQHGVRLLVIPCLKQPSIPELAIVIARLLKKSHPGIVVAQPAGPTFPRELAELRELAAARGWTLLEDEYHGETVPHRWKCSVGDHPAWLAEPYRIRKGVRCAHCVGVGRKNIAWLRRSAAAYELEVLSATYRGTNHKYSWRCRRGHEFSAILSNLKQRIRRNPASHACPDCTGSTRRRPRGSRVKTRSS